MSSLSTSTHARVAFALAGGLCLVACSCSCGEQPAPATGAAAEQADTPGEERDTAQQDSSPARSGRAGSAAPVTVTGEEPYESAALGALHGTILFTGEAPERFPLGAAQRDECKHHPEVDQRANTIVVNGDKLAGVFVHLRSGYDGKTIPPAPASPATLDQRGCMYVPRVIALQLGQKLLISNSDPTNHNVHAKPKKNGEVNKNMGIGPTPLEFAFERAEKGVPFACDIHPWMGAVVFVEEHPWFAVTGEDGAFRIRDVPPGEYVVEAVHEKLGSVAGRVQVTAGRSTGFTFTLRAKD